jgi:3-oxoacyl-[acyl-carrier protein] reductase
VLVHYGRAASEADAVVDQIKGDGGRARAIAADLATAEGPNSRSTQVP